MPKKGDGRVAFLSLKSEIRDRLEKGHTMRSIWREFQPSLLVGYAQFSRYVKKYLSDYAHTLNTNDTTGDKNVRHQKSDQSKVNHIKRIQPERPKRFEFDPIADADDLI